MTFLKGYRTIAVNLLSIVILAGGYLTGTVTDASTIATIASIVNIATIALRFVTTTPAFQSTP